MISYLQGKIVLKKENFIILDVKEIGYKVYLSKRTLNKIPENEDFLKLFTFLYLREEKMELYGFLNFQELELFEILKGISGVGPKSALALSSFGSLEKLKEVLESPDDEFFREVKGIGKKRIQKIILEITGKIKNFEKEKIPLKDEALEALRSLGLSSQKAKSTLLKVPKEIKDPENRVKEALKILGRS